jgi:type I restriction enzyme S subunit
MTELPDGWTETALDEIAATSLGKMLDAKQQTGLHQTPYLRNVNVRWGTFDLTDVATMDIEPRELDRVLAQPGDLVACEGGEPGRSAVWRGKEAVALQKALHKIRPAEGVLPDYLALLLREQSSTGELGKLLTGTTIKHLPQEKLRHIRVPLAPTAEQERIVSAVEEVFSKVEAGEAGLGTVRQLFKRMRDAVLAAAVTGRLVPQDPTDTPATKLFADLGVEAVEPEGVSALPAGWAWTTVESIAARQRNALAIGPFGSNLTVADYSEDGIPLVFVRSIRRGDFRTGLKFISPAKAEELASHTVQLGDVLVTKMGDPPGDTAVYSEIRPAVITADCIKITCGPVVEPHYLSLAISAGETRRLLLTVTRGVAQKKVSLGRFRSLPVPVPPVEEQQRIVTEVERQRSFFEACELGIDRGLACAAALRRSVLKAAFEGKLVPQDPADEPASVLLARIRKERAATPKAARSRRTA